MQDDCTTNSHYPQLYSSLYKVARMQFLSLGVKGLSPSEKQDNTVQYLQIDSCTTSFSTLCPSRNSSPRLFSASRSWRFDAGSSSEGGDIVKCAAQHEDRTELNLNCPSSVILSAMLIWLGPSLSRLRSTLRRGLVSSFRSLAKWNSCSS